MALPNQLATTPARTFAVTVLAWIAAVGFALPLLWMLAGSFRTGTDIFANLYPLSWKLFFPSEMTFDNYATLVGGEFGLSVVNSIFVTAATVLVGLLICAMAAFALSILRFRGAAFVFALVVLSFLVPFDAIAVPLANLFRAWNLDNSYVGLILPGLANGFAIFVLRQFFMNIPFELAEAARVDGLGWWGIFWRIYLPLSKPALIGAGFTLFLFQWGAYLWPLMIGTDPSKVLGPIALANLAGQFEVDFGAIFAGAFLLTLVPLVLLLIFQRQFTESLASTGTKG
ncbi:ABC transporter permease subunit [Agromyces sp. CFH 90414]|uniref:ABC transporter permease subunit n=1 Tax=Agromyces agglutinans TaxID=2662258 RepID=A0A6I2FDG5_9MICO|nr:carbohydrate ABC transporter permease [Agromyces agglutinans]MRG60720.1 ABC transporter permease subunit [Agromyces agglutinans]